MFLNKDSPRFASYIKVKPYSKWDIRSSLHLIYRLIFFFLETTRYLDNWFTKDKKREDMYSILLKNLKNTNPPGKLNKFDNSRIVNFTRKVVSSTVANFNKGTRNYITFLMEKTSSFSYIVLIIHLIGTPFGFSIISTKKHIILERIRLYKLCTSWFWKEMYFLYLGCIHNKKRRTNMVTFRSWRIYQFRSRSNSVLGVWLSV